MDRPLSVTALRGRTSDRTDGGARGRARRWRRRWPGRAVVGEPGSRARATGTRICGLARLPARGRRAGRGDARAPGELAGADRVGLLDLHGHVPAVARRVPDVRVLWLDAHGDFNTPDTTPSGFLGGMCLAAACGRWDAGYGPRSTRERVLLLRRARARSGRARWPSGRPRVRRGRARAGGRSTSTSTATSSTRTCCPSQFPVPGGLSTTRSADAARRARAEGDVVGLEVTAFEAPEQGARAEPRADVRTTRLRIAPPRSGRRWPVTTASAIRAGSPPWPRAACSTAPPEAAFDRVTRLVAEVPARPRRAVHARHRRPPGVQELGRRRRRSRRRRSRTRSARHVGATPARRSEVVDARLHPRVRDNPAIEDFGIVAYLDAAETPTARALGALCAIDHEPRRVDGPRSRRARGPGAARRWPRSSCGSANRGRRRRGRRAALRGHARHAHAPPQPARAARGPRSAAAASAGRRRSRCSTCTACAGSTTLTATWPATSCWRASPRRLEPRWSAPGTSTGSAASQLCGADRCPRPEAVERRLRGAAPRADHAVGCRAATVELPARGEEHRGMVLRLADARLARYGHVATAGR